MGTKRSFEVAVKKNLWGGENKLVAMEYIGVNLIQ